MPSRCYSHPICNLIFVPVPTSNSDPIPTSNCAPIPNATPLLTCVSILTSVLILIYLPVLSLSFPGGTVVKNPPANAEDMNSLGWEDLLEEEMATHPRIPADKIPWTEASGRLQPMGSQRVGQDWACTHHHPFLYLSLQKPLSRASMLGIDRLNLHSVFLVTHKDRKHLLHSFFGKLPGSFLMGCLGCYASPWCWDWLVRWVMWLATPRSYPPMWIGQNGFSLYWTNHMEWVSFQERGVPKEGGKCLVGKNGRFLFPHYRWANWAQGDYFIFPRTYGK